MNWDLFLALVTLTVASVLQLLNDCDQPSRWLAELLLIAALLIPEPSVSGLGSGDWATGRVPFVWRDDFWDMSDR